MNNSEYIVNFLSQKDICDVFSIVGGHSLFINKAFASSSKFKVTYFHHEQSASMAADAYYRRNLKPAIVNVSAGPAALNTLNGLYGSFVDSIPVIYISGQPKLNLQVSSIGLPLRQFGDQEFDRISKLVESITKYSVKLTNSSNIQYEITKAYNFAMGGRPGPVWIDIPMDMQSATFDSRNNSKKLNLDYESNLNVIRKLSSKNQIELVLSRLEKAERPLIYAGPNVRTYGAYKAFCKLVEKAKIPVVTSWNAHDLLPTSNKFFVGRPGLRGERSGNWAVYACDTLLVLGDHLGFRQIGYQKDNYSPNSFKVLVEQDVNELNKTSLNIDLNIFADLNDFILKLTENIDKSSLKNFDEWTFRTRKIWNKYRPKFNDYDKTELINPYHFLSNLFECLSGGESIIIGNGISVVGSFQMAEIKSEQIMFQNYGCASMGYDLPAIVGAWLSCKKKTICITGDGSFQLNLQELQTIVSLDINSIIFVINNDGYDSIRQSQLMAFGSDSDFHGIGPSSGLSFPNLRKISDAYSIPYLKIESLEESFPKIKEALSFKRCICEVFVDKNQLFAPKVATTKNDDGTIKSGELIDMKPFISKEEINNVIEFLKSEQ
tara:strand:+ start:334 stop:2148 length:1815 start_codon:yes stop_codon:yes gene_type:complete